MPVEIPCTSCGQVLSIPDAVLGKMVRCSKCQAQFLAAAPAKITAAEEELVEFLDDDAKLGPPPGVDDDDDDNFDDRPRPRRKKKRRIRMGDPTASVATAMFILGWAGGAVSAIVLLILTAFNIVAISKGVPGNVNVGAIIVSTVFWISVTMTWSGLVLRASACMSNRDNYSMAVMGCIMAMLPCSCGWIGGLPIGIWSLIVLLRADVQARFR